MRAGVNVETLRYYERRGLLPDPDRDPSGHRRYDEESVRFLRAIKEAQAVGYREVFRHLDGELTLEEAVGLLQTRSRHLAKRQLTWFRRLPECRPVKEDLTFALWGLRM